MHAMGMVNAVVPHAELEATALEWGREINGKSPTAQRMLKFAFNLIDDGLVGQQVFAGEATRLAYMTDEAEEGRDASSRGATPTGRPTPTTSDRAPLNLRLREFLDGPPHRKLRKREVGGGMEVIRIEDPEDPGTTVPAQRARAGQPDRQARRCRRRDVPRRG